MDGVSSQPLQEGISLFTPLRHLKINNHCGGNVRCLTGLQSLSLSDVEISGLPLWLRAAAVSYGWGCIMCPCPLHLISGAHLSPLSWPSLVGLQLSCVQAGVISHVLPTPHVAPQLGRLVLPNDELDSQKEKGPQGLKGSRCFWVRHRGGCK